MRWLCRGRRVLQSTRPAVKLPNRVQCSQRQAGTLAATQSTNCIWKSRIYHSPWLTKNRRKRSDSREWVTEQRCWNQTPMLHCHPLRLVRTINRQDLLVWWMAWKTHRGRMSSILIAPTPQFDSCHRCHTVWCRQLQWNCRKSQGVTITTRRTATSSDISMASWLRSWISTRQWQEAKRWWTTTRIHRCKIQRPSDGRATSLSYRQPTVKSLRAGSRSARLARKARKVRRFLPWASNTDRLNLVNPYVRTINRALHILMFICL